MKAEGRIRDSRELWNVHVIHSELTYKMLKGTVDLIHPKLHILHRQSVPLPQKFLACPRSLRNKLCKG